MFREFNITENFSWNLKGVCILKSFMYRILGVYYWKFMACEK